MASKAQIQADLERYERWYKESEERCGKLSGESYKNIKEHERVLDLIIDTLGLRDKYPREDTDCYDSFDTGFTAREQFVADLKQIAEFKDITEAKKRLGVK